MLRTSHECLGTDHLVQIFWYGGEETIIQDFSGGNLREGDHLKDPGVDVRIILKWIFEKWDGGLD